MKILHVSCSPRGQLSESYRISRKIIEFLRVKEPSAVLTNRVIGGGANRTYRCELRVCAWGNQVVLRGNIPNGLHVPIRRTYSGAGALPTTWSSELLCITSPCPLH